MERAFREHRDDNAYLNNLRAFIMSRSERERDLLDNLLGHIDASVPESHHDEESTVPNDYDYYYERVAEAISALESFFSHDREGSEAVNNMLALIDENLQDEEFMECKNHFQELSNLINSMGINIRTQMAGSRTISDWIVNSINSLEELISE
jgi:hypothetical protein